MPKYINPEQKKADLVFLQEIIEKGGPKSAYESSRFYTMITQYPDEVWLLGTVLNITYYEESLKKLIEKTQSNEQTAIVQK